MLGFYLPGDILEFCIFKNVSMACLVACSMVCSRFRSITSRILESMDKLHDKTTLILEEIYEIGSLHFLKWFESALRFPSRSQVPARCLNIAAESKLLFIFVLFLSCYLIIIIIIIININMAILLIERCATQEDIFICFDTLAKLVARLQRQLFAKRRPKADIWMC